MKSSKICRVEEKCPSGYRRSELVEIALACGIEIKRPYPKRGNKNMTELCAEITTSLQKKTKIQIKSTTTDSKTSTSRCEIKDGCPRGYSRKELVTLARKCDLDIKRPSPKKGDKNMKELCAEMQSLQEEDKPSKSVGVGSGPRARATGLGARPCTVREGCPRGYSRKELVDLATQCKIDIKRQPPKKGDKNMKELCADLFSQQVLPKASPEPTVTYVKEIPILDYGLGRPISPKQAWVHFFNKQIDPAIADGLKQPLELIPREGYSEGYSEGSNAVYKMFDPILLEEVELDDRHYKQLKECGHIFDVETLSRLIADNTKMWQGRENVGFKCPICDTIYGNLVSYGSDPKDGRYPQASNITMIIEVENEKLVYDKDSPPSDEIIIISFRPPLKHIRAGKIKLYYPNTAEGRLLVCLFKEAWQKGLLMVSDSPKKGKNYVRYTGIHKKTALKGAHGYPDSTFLERELGDLALFGITPYTSSFNSFGGCSRTSLENGDIFDQKKTAPRIPYPAEKRWEIQDNRDLGSSQDANNTCINVKTLGGEMITEYDMEPFIRVKENKSVYCFKPHDLQFILEFTPSGSEYINPFTNKPFQDQNLGQVISKSKNFIPTFTKQIAKIQSKDNKFCPIFKTTADDVVFVESRNSQLTPKSVHKVSKVLQKAKNIHSTWIFKVKLKIPDKNVDDVWSLRHLLKNSPEKIKEVKMVYSYKNDELEPYPDIKCKQGCFSQKVFDDLEKFMNRPGMDLKSETISKLQEMAIRPNKPVHALRGLHFSEYNVPDEIRYLKVGDEISITDKRVQSWTTNLCTALGFADKGRDSIGFVFETELSPSDILLDTRMIQPSYREKIYHSSQSEIMTRPGTKDVTLKYIIYDGDFSYKQLPLPE